MIISSDGYYLSYDKMRNYIVIHLPQTSETLENTIDKPVDRRTDVAENNLTVLLQIAKILFEKGGITE